MDDTFQYLAALSKVLSATEGDTNVSVIRVVAHMFNAEGAALWLLNKEKSALERKATFHIDGARSNAFEQETEETSLKFGQSLPGLAWAEGKAKILQLPAMFAQGAHEAHKSDSPLCSIAFPLRGGGTIFGVIEVINCNDSICRGEKEQLVEVLSSFLGASFYSLDAARRLSESESEIAGTANKLRAISEDMRELKERLSKEHDQSVQNARFHAQFLAHISRDIRTPLSGITSVVELMQKNGLPKEQDEYAGIIKESAAQVLSVVEELVEFSRQEAELFSPSDATADSADSASQIASKDQAATATTPSAVPNLDKIRVLVITGLIGSAEFIEAYATASGIKCESTSRGASALTAMKQAILIDKPYDVIFVERLLPDMDAFEFARTVQGDSSLAHSKLILVSTFDSAARDDFALRAGFIEHIAKPVKQQQVISTLANVVSGKPHMMQEEQQQQVLVQEQVAPAVARGQRMILVAEDNPVNQKVALLQLRELGFFATVVTNGREAVEVVKQAHFDAVLMDCQMPEMNGFDATREIRAWEKQTGRHIPIIAMTAGALNSDREKCIAVGMDDYLSKPVTYDKLDSVLSKWVEFDQTKELAGERYMHQPNSEMQVGMPNAEPVDMAGLIELLGPDEAAEVLQLFVNSTEELISQIQDAADRHDPKALKEAAHQLKGAASSVGADHIARACLELEKCAKNDQWDSVPSIHAGLSETFENAKSYIQTITS